MITYEEFKELQEADRILVLPCKIGSTIYEIPTYCDSRGGCAYPLLDCNICSCRSYLIEETNFVISMLNDIGKSLFLTHKEAEKELERLNKEREEMINDILEKLAEKKA